VSARRTHTSLSIYIWTYYIFEATKRFFLSSFCTPLFTRSLWENHNNNSNNIQNGCFNSISTPLIRDRHTEYFAKQYFTPRTNNNLWRCCTHLQILFYCNGQYNYLFIFVWPVQRRLFIYIFTYCSKYYILTIKWFKNVQ
jgi:hypothetical protein